MSEEPLERSQATIENAREAADEVRKTEPFHRDDDDPDPATVETDPEREGPQPA